MCACKTDIFYCANYVRMQDSQDSCVETVTIKFSVFVYITHMSSCATGNVNVLEQQHFNSVLTMYQRIKGKFAKVSVIAKREKAQYNVGVMNRAKVRRGW